MLDCLHISNKQVRGSVNREVYIIALCCLYHVISNVWTTILCELNDYIIDAAKILEYSLNSFPSMLLKSYNTNCTCTLDEFITIFGKILVYKVHV